MMLTVKQPVYHGYQIVHDLPTPPSAARFSPQLAAPEASQNPLPALPQKTSPSIQVMSAPHPRLPLPAPMGLPQPTPAAPGPALPAAPAPSLHAQPPPPPPPPPAAALGALPAPPSQWQGQGSEESMRNWLLAKTEEEKRRQQEERTRQEEERTRQESLRLEQRRVEIEMLRLSLDRGIPPPMVPVVFAGMGGGNLPQTALEWAQQYLVPQQTPAQLLPAQQPVSPEHRRDSQPQPYAPYAGPIGVPSTPGSGTVPQQPAFVPYQGPGSPGRPRAHTLGIGRPLGSSLPRLSTSELGGVPSGVGHTAHSLTQQQETQSPSIYFHHWQPPTSQAGNQPATPSVDSPRKRKATGPQHSAPRFKSPPFGQSAGPSSLSNPPSGRRRGHSRQRSDISSYRGSIGRGRGVSPAVSTPREPPLSGSSSSALPRSSAHTVSSMLSDEPSPQYPAETRSQQQTGEAERQTPIHSEGGSHSGGTAGSAHPHEPEHD